MSDRKLDEAVAEKVLGLKVLGPSGPFRTVCALDEHSNEAVRLPEYSTDIKEAWKVRDSEKFRGHHLTVESSGGDVRATFTEYGKRHANVGYSDSGTEEEMAAKAICLAALKVVGVEFDEVKP